MKMITKRARPAPAAEVTLAGVTWTLDHADDPRTLGFRAALYRRELPGGVVPGQLTEWMVAIDGRAGERWIGPAMDGWSHPLVSAWNPVLAQGSDADPRDAVGFEAWTGWAIMQGHKPSGYFGISPRRAQRAWVHDALTRGLDVRPIGRQRLSTCCHAAQPGTLRQVFGDDALAALAAEYRRVMVACDAAELADDIEADLLGHADTQVIDLSIDHEEVPMVVCGLVLGYPPEVTAGCLLHQRRHPGRRCLADYAEAGAACRDMP